MEFLKRFSGLEGKDLNDAIAAFQQDLEEYLSQMINEKHAPIMVPRTTIDAAHAQKNLQAADAAGNWTALSWQNSLNTTSLTSTTIFNYAGRGVLTKLAIAEVTAAANNNRAFGVKLTVDDNVLFNDASTALTRESAIRAIVGNLVEVSGTNFALVDETPGIPFNSSCKVEANSDGTRTLSIGWKIAKKL